MIVFAALVL